MNGKIPWKRGGRVFAALLREFGLKVDGIDNETLGLLLRVCEAVEFVVRMRLDRLERRGPRQSGAADVGRGRRPMDGANESGRGKLEFADARPKAAQNSFGEVFRRQMDKLLAEFGLNRGDFDYETWALFVRAFHWRLPRRDKDRERLLKLAQNVLGAKVKRPQEGGGSS